MAAVAAVLSPLSGFRLFGAGERTARAPAPGAVPREEPLLPRLETLLGALAARYWLGVGGGCCGQWGGCVAGPALELLIGGAGGVCAVSPPLLTTRVYIEGEGWETRIYVDASTWLLRVDNIDSLERYVEAAGLLLRARRELLPGHKLKAEQQAKDIIERLVENADLVPAWAVSRRLTHIALQRDTKTAEHGLLYSLPRVSYNTLYTTPRGRKIMLTTPRLVLLAACTSGTPASLDTLLTVGPRGGPARLQTLGANEETAHTLLDAPEEPPAEAIVASLQPARSHCREAAHPGLPVPIELHAAAYRERPGTAEPPDTTPPHPALRPGTVLTRNTICIKGNTLTAQAPTGNPLALKLLRTMEPHKLKAMAKAAEDFLKDQG